MEKFTQKWCVVAFAEPLDEGAKFHWKNWPLHITIVAVFGIDSNGFELSSELTKLLSNQEPIDAMVGQEVQWGDNNQVKVMLIDKSSEIMGLHDRVYEFLVGLGAEFNDPHFEGENYQPHSTFQNGVHLQGSQHVRINSVSIIDMFPDSDGHKRKIVKTIYFS